MFCGVRNPGTISKGSLIQQQNSRNTDGYIERMNIGSHSNELLLMERIQKQITSVYRRGQESKKREEFILCWNYVK